MPAPDLRLVPADLCEAVDARRHSARRAYLGATKGERFGRPAHGFESKYLLTGLVRCGRCGGNLVVRSRSHGRRRVFFYACSAFHHRGKTICANGLDAPMRAADDAILGEIEGYVLHPDVVDRALALALEELRPKAGRVEDERGLLRAEIRRVEQELERLTTALAAGGELSSVVRAIQARERVQAGLTERRRSLERVRDFTVGDAAQVERRLRARLSDWRGLLRGDVREARQILRALLQDQDKIEFTPVEQGGQRLYRYRATFNAGALMAGVIDPQAWASPTGFEPVFCLERAEEAARKNCCGRAASPGQQSPAADVEDLQHPGREAATYRLPEASRARCALHCRASRSSAAESSSWVACQRLPSF